MRRVHSLFYGSILVAAWGALSFVAASERLLLRESFEEPNLCFNQRAERPCSEHLRSQGDRVVVVKEGGWEPRPLDGLQCVKTSIRYNPDGSSYRSELNLSSHRNRGNLKKRLISSREIWVEFSIYLPADYEPDPIREIVSQWLEDGENNQAVALTTHEGEWRLETVKGQVDEEYPIINGKKILYRAPYQRERWTNWKFHLIWSVKEDGLIEAWRDEEKVVSYRGANQYSTKIFPYWKFGIYKSKWKNRGLNELSVRERRLYFDNLTVKISP